MSPRSPDPNVRLALLDAAARLLADEGPDALSIRRLAAEVGTSTMAVYTHFGGKEELLRAVVVEGFARLAERLAHVEDTDDPVCDIYLLGAAYRRNALDNPHLYTAMFGRPLLEAHLTDRELAATVATFTTLVRACQRSIDAGRLEGDASDIANQMWSALHGVVMLELNGCYPATGGGEHTMAALGRNLLLALSTDRERTERSIAAAVARLGEAAGV